MRVLKILGAIVVVLIVAVGGALVWVSSQDFSQYRGEIAERVKAATGRELALKGKLDLKIGLTPSLVVNDVTFQNASWGSRPDMAKLSQLDVELRLVPLIFGDIKVNRVVLKGADILLETDKQGRNNWEFGERKAASGGSGAPAASSGGMGTIPQVDRLAITDSVVSVRNAQTGQNTKVDVKKLDVSGIAASGTTKVDFNGALNGSPVTATASIQSLLDLVNGGSGAVDMSVKAGGSNVTLVGPIKQGAPAGVKVSAEGQSLATLKPLVGAAMPALGPYSLAGVLSSPSKNSYRLNISKLKVGSTDLAGDMVIGAEGGKPKLTATLTSTRVDTKDFLKSAGAGGSTGGSETKSSDGRVFPADPLPVEDLRLANVALSLKAGEVINEPAKMQNFVLAVNLTNGRLSIKPSATVSGGSVGGDIVLDGSGPTAQLSATVQGRNVSVGDLLKMLQNSDVIRGGPATVDVKVQGSGNSIRAIMASLNGTTSVDMGPGTLNNGKVAFLTADFMKLLTTGGGAETQIKCIVSKFRIVNGLATSEALGLDSTNLSATGSGTINLANEHLKLRINPSTHQPALASLAVPVNIGGTLAKPEATPDIAGAVLGSPQNVLGTVGGEAKSVTNMLGSITGGGKSGSQTTASASASGCGAPAAAAAPAETQQQKSQTPTKSQPTAPSSPVDKVKKLFR